MITLEVAFTDTVWMNVGMVSSIFFSVFPSLFFDNLDQDFKGN